MKKIQNGKPILAEAGFEPLNLASFEFVLNLWFRHSSFKKVESKTMRFAEQMEEAREDARPPHCRSSFIIPQCVTA